MVLLPTVSDSAETYFTLVKTPADFRLPNSLANSPFIDYFTQNRPYRFGSPLLSMPLTPYTVSSEFQLNPRME